MNTTEVFSELHAVLQHYDACHRNAEDSKAHHITLETQVEDIRRAYTTQLYADIANDAKLKILCSNQERREIEVERRLESDIPEMLKQEREAKEQRQRFAAELERSQEALKTYRALAGLMEAEKRLEAVTTDVASMPRMIRR